MNPSPIYIGSDPELLLAKTNPNTLKTSFLNASSYISDLGNVAPFGLDGHSSTAELRPKPATDPIAHVKNIKKIFESFRNNGAYKEVFKLDFYASAMQDPIGGHIHIGHPSIEGKDNSDPTVVKLVNALDSLVSFPLMFVENPEHAKARKERYGALRDVRKKSYGIEYRTPSSWLSSEELATSVICLAYTVADEVLNRGYSLSNPVSRLPIFSDAYMTHSVDLLYPHLANVKKIIRTDFKLYPTYRNQIEFLLRNATHKRILFNQEIKKGWKIPYTHVRRIIMFSLLQLVSLMSKNIASPKESERELMKFVLRNSEDYQIPTIQTNINNSLTKVLEPKKEAIERFNPVAIFARKKEYGNTILIQFDPQRVPIEKIRKLARIMVDTIKAFEYPDTVEIQVKQREVYTVDSDVNHFTAPIRIGLGRGLREYKKYLCECLVFLAVLYANDTIYRSFKISKKTGEKVTLPMITKNIVSKLVKPLYKKEKKMESAKEGQQ